MSGNNKNKESIPEGADSCFRYTASERTVLPFPSTPRKFRTLENHCYINKEYPPSYTFGDGKNKLNIFADTLERLQKSNEILTEVNLSLTETKEIELPDIKGKSRKEILDIFANGADENHKELVNALKRYDIDHIVISFTKSVYLKDCDWNTLVQISILVKELQCDLTVSGGREGRYESPSYKK